MAESEFSDDDSIEDDDELWRCIPYPQWEFDSNRSKWRPHSIAFRDNSNGDPMSAFIANECGGREALLALLPRCTIVRFTARLARQCGLMIARDPLHGGSGHVVVVGNKEAKFDYAGGRVKARQILAYECSWIVPPPESTA